MNAREIMARLTRAAGEDATFRVWFTGPREGAYPNQWYAEICDGTVDACAHHADLECAIDACLDDAEARVAFASQDLTR